MYTAHSWHKTVTESFWNYNNLFFFIISVIHFHIIYSNSNKHILILFFFFLLQPSVVEGSFIKYKEMQRKCTTVVQEPHQRCLYATLEHEGPNEVGCFTSSISVPLPGKVSLAVVMHSVLIFMKFCCKYQHWKKCQYNPK